MGMFGENFTRTVCRKSPHILAIGSRRLGGSCGDAARLPCYKLGLKFQSDDMVRRFLASGRTGFYLAVTREGDVGAGDESK